MTSFKVTPTWRESKAMFAELAVSRERVGRGGEQGEAFDIHNPY
jgi:hypothetical protein